MATPINVYSNKQVIIKIKNEMKAKAKELDDLLLLAVFGTRTPAIDQKRIRSNAVVGRALGWTRYKVRDRLNILLK